MGLLSDISGAVLMGQVVIRVPGGDATRAEVATRLLRFDNWMER